MRVGGGGNTPLCIHCQITFPGIDFKHIQLKGIEKNNKTRHTRYDKFNEALSNKMWNKRKNLNICLKLYPIYCMCYLRSQIKPNIATDKSTHKRK